MVAIVAIIALWNIFHTSFNLDETVELKAGDSAQVILNTLGWKNKTQVKLYIRNHNIDLSKVQDGNYVFSGTYTPESFVEAIQAGPQVAYAKITILEGWSIYDIDQYLTDK